MNQENTAGSGRNLILATLAFALCFSAWGMLAPIAPGIQDDLGLSDTQTAIMISIPVILGSLLRIPLGLITDRVGGSPPLQAALHAALGELARLDLDRVSTVTLTSLLETSVRAAAQRLDFLDKVKIGSTSAKPAIAQVLEAVLSVAFPEDGDNARAAWTLARADVLEAVVSIAFEELAETGIDAGKLQTLRDVLARVVDRLENRQSFSLQNFAEELQLALAA